MKLPEFARFIYLNTKLKTETSLKKKKKVKRYNETVPLFFI